MKLRTGTFGRPAALRASAGFSLVELMVTVSLVAILTAIAVPMLRDSMANNRLTSQTNEMIAAMTLARSNAITLNRQVTFCRADSEATNTCSTSTSSWPFWLVTTTAAPVIVFRRGATLASSLAVTSTLTNSQIAFGSDGLARTNNNLINGQQIVICSNHSTTDNIRQVTLGAGSRVSTAKASGACP